MRNFILMLILTFFCKQLKSQNASIQPQDNKVIAFLQNIFSIEHLLEKEKKNKLKRELSYFAQDMYKLILLKEKIANQTIYCCEYNYKECRSELIEHFNYNMQSSLNHLNNIKHNILFSSDYNIVIETYYKQIKINKDESLYFKDGCTIHPVSVYKDYGEPIFTGCGNNKNYANQPTFNVSDTYYSQSEIIDTVYFMCCPEKREKKQYLPSWKTVTLSFEGLLEGYRYSLAIKGENIYKLLEECDIEAIIKEKNTAIQVLKKMRDEALRLEREIE